MPRYVQVFVMFVVNNDKPSGEEGAEEDKGDEGSSLHLKNQSVLQTKLTKLAIQIGYAGGYNSLHTSRYFSM